MYKNYVQRLLFLPNMVTEVMHLAINVYLDGGKPDTCAGFDMTEVSLLWRLLIIASCWGGGGIEFSLTRDAMLEWKLRKSWLPLKLHKQAGRRGGGVVIAKDGSHSSNKDLWISY